MKSLYRFLTAALWAVSLGMTALADALPPPDSGPEPVKRGPITVVFIIAVVAIAVAVLAVILRRRKR